MRRLAQVLTAVTLSLEGASALAQTSSHYILEEHTLNAGAHPAAGVVMTSAVFRVTLDAIGDGTTAPSVVGAQYRLTAGFVGTYPPPGEVRNLRMLPLAMLLWDPDGAAGDYNIYRALLNTLSGLTFGACAQSEVPQASATDATVPGPGQGFFYLVTAENRLDEEGTKGFRSNGVMRANAAPCP